MSKFASIADLPQQVRENLDVNAQQVWLDTFNSTNSYPQAWSKVLESVTASEYGYWIDLAKYTFTEGQETWIQALPLGTYTHPRHGKIEVTPARVQQFAANVNNRVREQDLDVDYDHKILTTEAAGWIRKAEARSNGLWIAVEWTQSALTKLKERAFRYFSPEFVDDWTHPKTQVKYKDVLFGGALTNRPFLKDILPINLSEVLQTNEGGNLVDRAALEKLAKKLGIQFDEKTTDEQLVKALDEVPEPKPDPEPKKEEPEPKKEEETPPVDDKVPVTASDLKAVADENKRLSEEVATLKAANRLSSLTIQLGELDSEDYAIAPAVRDELRDALVGAPKELADKVLSTIKKMTDGKGIVQLSEVGRTRKERTGEDPVKQFSDMVDKIVKDGDGKVDYAAAAQQVAETEPILFTEYQKATYIREGV